MIPEELHLKNFLSHRETDLDLRGVHLASLVGENGAGKSSLLDAITWGVWGRSRAQYGRDENLIYHGESDLEVELVFRMLYQGGKIRHFRILRRREQRGRRTTNSILDFQAETDAGWRSLNADNIRETQSRIIEQIGLDYDTFINSAYLRQGHADEFTVQTPTARKHVLSAILGLDRWSTYQERVKAELAAVKGRLQEITRRLSEIQAELERRDEYEAQLAEAEAQAEATALRLQAVQEQVDVLTRLQEQLVALKNQHRDLANRIRQEEERLYALEQEQQDQQQQLSRYQEQLTQAEAIDAAYQAYQMARSEDQAWNEKLSQVARLQQQKSDLEHKISLAREGLVAQFRDIEREESRYLQVITQARQQLEQSISDLRGQIRLLEERIPGAEMDAQLAEAEAALAVYLELTEQHGHIQAELQGLEVERSRLKERNRQLRDLMNAKKADLDVLAKAEAVCPLCRQSLTLEHRERLVEQIQGEGAVMGDEFRANRQQLLELDVGKVSLADEIKELDVQLQGRAEKEHIVARLSQQVEQGADAAQRIMELQTTITELERQIVDENYGGEARSALTQVLQDKAACQLRLDKQEYALAEQIALGELLEHLAELGYDIDEHDRIKARLRDLATAEAAYRDLEKARVGVSGVQQTLDRLAQEVAQQTKQIAALRKQQVTLDEESAAIEGRLADGGGVVQQLHLVRMDEARARQRVGAARQTLAALETLEKRRGEQSQERDALAKRKGVLSELRDAFGVNGIPAMIIEHTLPELEREANRILQQLTGGRMHVRFDTQRETKSGSLRETLDIIISDEKGTRPYENFSGGEQFRVNFAIRVALSRLLAQRAGVQLRALFVDEGFGSLDADGRQRLVEAVKAVQEDFELVLVITHIDELRDAFPTRIQVTKLDSGSFVEII
ncbi:MAG: SMC family ATPase [Anaerolineae bacterium]|nr:SMC family ATPase [Anaerolineae bacterium]